MRLTETDTTKLYKLDWNEIWLYVSFWPPKTHKDIWDAIAHSGGFLSHIQQNSFSIEEKENKKTTLVGPEWKGRQLIWESLKQQTAAATTMNYMLWFVCSANYKFGVSKKLNVIFFPLPKLFSKTPSVNLHILSNWVRHLCYSLGKFSFWSHLESGIPLQVPDVNALTQMCPLELKPSLKKVEPLSDVSLLSDAPFKLLHVPCLLVRKVHFTSLQSNKTH